MKRPCRAPVPRYHDLISRRRPDAALPGARDRAQPPHLRRKAHWCPGPPGVDAAVDHASCCCRVGPCGQAQHRCGAGDRLYEHLPRGKRNRCPRPAAVRRHEAGVSLARGGPDRVAQGYARRGARARRTGQVVPGLHVAGPRSAAVAGDHDHAVLTRSERPLRRRRHARLRRGASDVRRSANRARERPFDPRHPGVAGAKWCHPRESTAPAGCALRGERHASVCTTRNRVAREVLHHRQSSRHPHLAGGARADR